MKKLKIMRTEYIKDVRYYEVEIDSEQFPEILKEDFDIDDPSDELYEFLIDADWNFLHDKAISPDLEYRIKPEH